MPATAPNGRSCRVAPSPILCLSARFPFMWIAGMARS